MGKEIQVLSCISHPEGFLSYSMLFPMKNRWSSPVWPTLAPSQLRPLQSPPRRPKRPSWQSWVRRVPGSRHFRVAKNSIPTVRNERAHWKDLKGIISIHINGLMNSTMNNQDWIPIPKPDTLNHRTPTKIWSFTKIQLGQTIGACI